MTKWHGGKGSASRKGADQDKFESNWERIFGKKTLVELLDDECNKECIFDTQEEHDPFELEQAIMSCWCIIEDLQLLADAMESGENKRMHLEMLLNLSQLYGLKFQKLFKEFNKFLRYE